MPPVSDRSLLEQGILHSPEFACLPFKTIMVILFTELNMERTGFFSAVAVPVQIRLFWKASGRNIKKHWYDVNFIYIDLSNISVKEVLEKIRPLTEGKSIFELLKAIFSVKHNLTRLSPNL